MELKHLNILLTDDDADDCAFFRKALSTLPLSAELTILNDGEQLMQYLLNESNEIPDVIFLDLNMPRKNGSECVSEIKKSDRLKNIPVVIFSTSSNEGIMKQLFKAGVHIYVRKPNDFQQLKEIIYNALPLAAEKTFSTSSVNYILNA
ncbi:MAG TPA: response regulator [Chitinophagales bacterium]|nr:response regulator [Chitinophagales bacterium]HLP49435.1 response regulator [Chitinophagales bacterium]